MRILSTHFPRRKFFRLSNRFPNAKRFHLHFQLQNAHSSACFMSEKLYRMKWTQPTGNSQMRFTKKSTKLAWAASAQASPPLPRTAVTPRVQSRPPASTCKNYVDILRMIPFRKFSFFFQFCAHSFNYAAAQLLGNALLPSNFLKYILTFRDSRRSACLSPSSWVVQINLYMPRLICHQFPSTMIYAWNLPMFRSLRPLSSAHWKVKPE